MPHSDAPIDMVTTTYVVHDDQVLLVFHRALQRWLAPGGHIDLGETPDQAAVREVREETGLDVLLLSPVSDTHHFDDVGVRMLTLPIAVQLEDIHPGHQHVDFVYVGTTDSPDLKVDLLEVVEAKWFSTRELERGDIAENVRRVARLAMSIVRAGGRPASRYAAASTSASWVTTTR